MQKGVQPVFEGHFKLSRTVFSRETPVQALFLTPGHREAISRLRHVAERRLNMLLTGEPGVGKSTILRRLKHDLDPAHYDVLYLNQSGATPRSFYTDLLSQLRVEMPFHLTQARTLASKALLERFRTHGRTPILLLDEAQEMPDKLFDELRGLLNYDYDSFTPFAMVLAGHPRLARRLTMQHHTALASRLPFQAHLDPFTQEESMAYIQHHLDSAGAQHPIFTESALKKLHQSTGGNARGLNNIAVLCLMSACHNKLDLVDDELVSTIVATETRGGLS